MEITPRNEEDAFVPSVIEEEVEIEVGDGEEEVKEQKWKWRTFRCSAILFLLFLFCILIGVATNMTIFYSSSRMGNLESQFGQPVECAGIVIDMGSSGTRVSIFGWDNEHVVQPVPYGAKTFLFLRTSKAVSKYDTPEEAANSLVPLLDYAQRAVLAIQSNLTETPIFVYGTAGLRSLPPEESNSILNAIELLLKESYHFKLVENWLGILKGQEEAAFDWLSVQQTEYIAAENDMDFPFIQTGYPIIDYEITSQNVGIMDMGGSSLEIAFSSSMDSFDNNSTQKYFEDLQFENEKYKVYSISYPGLGMNKAFQQYQDIIVANAFAVHDYSLNYTDPCLPDGCTIYSKLGSGESITLRGFGNIRECRRSIAVLLNVTSSCKYDTCAMDGEYQPRVMDSPFIAFSGFTDTCTFFGLSGQFPLSDLSAATAAFCTTPWDDLVSRYSSIGMSNGQLAEFCFKGLFVFDLLTSGYVPTSQFPSTSTNHTTSMGFNPNSQQIGFHSTLFQKVEVSWALGMISNYVETNQTNLTR